VRVLPQSPDTSTVRTRLRRLSQIAREFRDVLNISAHVARLISLPKAGVSLARLSKIALEFRDVLNISADVARPMSRDEAGESSPRLSKIPKCFFGVRDRAAMRPKRP